jgi:uroporphyrinogen decarboxylase
MRNSSWNDLLVLIDGKKLNYQPVGFIVDSPWIPGWYGIPVIDYYTSDEQWLKSNLKAIDTFPDVWFMPGFWSEYGMCTEPSAFGSRMISLKITSLMRKRSWLIFRMLTGCLSPMSKLTDFCHL